MPLIAPHYVKTKKELKKLLLEGRRLYFDDPAVFNPKSFVSTEMKPGDTFICTNHPKRSWFASITRTEKGWTIK